MPPVVVPVRTVQEAVAAVDLPPLDADAANVFSRIERILQDHVGRTQNPGRSANRIRLCRHAAGPGQQQQVLRRVYEVNIWMWRYSRPPRMVSIAMEERIRAGRLSESRIRAAETRKRRSEAAAAAGAAEGGGGLD
jgi:hypothetical protein